MSAVDEAPATGRSVERPSLVGRLLLTTDGTVTTMLEELAGERIRTEALDHGGTAPGHVLAALGADGGCGPVVMRSTLLVGATSGITLVRARAVLVPDALPSVYHDLTTTREPIGRILRRHRVETFRELLGGRLLFAGENPDPLDDSTEKTPEPDGSAQVTGAFRTYRVFTGGRLAMFVGEVFTAACLGLGHTAGAEER